MLDNFEKNKFFLKNNKRFIIFLFIFICSIILPYICFSFTDESKIESAVLFLTNEAKKTETGSIALKIDINEDKRGSAVAKGKDININYVSYKGLDSFSTKTMIENSFKLVDFNSCPIVFTNEVAGNDQKTETGETLNSYLGTQMVSPINRYDYSKHKSFLYLTTNQAKYLIENVEEYSVYSDVNELIGQAITVEYNKNGSTVSEEWGIGNLMVSGKERDIVNEDLYGDYIYAYLPSGVSFDYKISVDLNNQIFTNNNVVKTLRKNIKNNIEVLNGKATMKKEDADNINNLLNAYTSGNNILITFYCFYSLLNVLLIGIIFLLIESKNCKKLLLVSFSIFVFIYLILFILYSFANSIVFVGLFTERAIIFSTMSALLSFSCCGIKTLWKK